MPTSELPPELMQLAASKLGYSTNRLRKMDAQHILDELEEMGELSASPLPPLPKLPSSSSSSSLAAAAGGGGGVGKQRQQHSKRAPPRRSRPLDIPTPRSSKEVEQQIPSAAAASTKWSVPAPAPPVVVPSPGGAPSSTHHPQQPRTAALSSSQASQASHAAVVVGSGGGGGAMMTLPFTPEQIPALCSEPAGRKQLEQGMSAMIRQLAEINGRLCAYQNSLSIMAACAGFDQEDRIQYAQFHIKQLVCEQGRIMTLIQALACILEQKLEQQHAVESSFQDDVSDQFVAYWARKQSDLNALLVAARKLCPRQL